jgi:hypothetical protein
VLEGSAGLPPIRRMVMVLVPIVVGGSQNKSAPLKSKRIVLRFDMRFSSHDFSAYGKLDFFVYGMRSRMQY